MDGRRLIMKIGKDSLASAVDKMMVPVSCGKNIKVKMSIRGKSKRTEKGSYACLEAYDGTATQVAAYFFASIDEEEDIELITEGKDLISTIKVLAKIGKDFEIRREGSSITIAAGMDEVRKSLYSDCPLITSDASDKPFAQIAVKRDKFFAALGRGGYAFSSTNVLNGVYVDFSGVELSVYSADGMRVAKASCECKIEKMLKGSDLTAYIPTTILKCESIFDDEDITISLTNSKLIIRDKASFVVLNKLTSAFPVSLKGIGVEPKATLSLSKKALMNAFEILLLTEEVKENPVSLIIEKANIYMISALGSAKASVEGTISGELDGLCVNLAFLKEAVAVTGEKICLEYEASKKPIKVYTENDSKNYSIVSLVNPATKKKEEKEDKSTKK